MQTVKKNICLEDYKARLGTRVPICENGVGIYGEFSTYNDWGRIPYDIIIEENSIYADLIDIAKKLPLSTIITKKGVTTYYYINTSKLLKKVVDTFDNKERFVLKYKVISDRYFFLKKLMREAKYYRPCLIKGEYKWVELSDNIWETEFDVRVDNLDGTENSNINVDKFFAQKVNDDSDYNWLMSNTLPPIDGEETRYCCIWDNMDVFLSYFRLEDSNKRYEKTFFVLVNDLYTTKVQGMKFTQQYISLPLCLTESVELFSTYTPYIQEWEPKKRFYVGDYVHYVMDNALDPLGNTYKLRDDATDLLTEWIDVPTDIYNVFGDNRKRIKDDVLQICVKYYKGYFDDRSKLIYFDKVDNNGKILVDASGNTEHWRLCTSSDITPESETISAITDSYLTFLQRKKRSFDDYGNELPFIIDDLNTTNTELNYLLGIHNSETNENYAICDVLQTINFYDENSSAITYAYEYINENSISPIRAIDENRPSSCKYIGFEYYDNCRVVDNLADTTTGVLHKEIYSFTVDTMCAKVNEANGEFVWVVTGGTANETVSKLPPPSAGIYNKTYKFKYTGIPIYREMGRVIQIVDSGTPTATNPTVGDLALSRSGDAYLYIYTDIYQDTNNSIVYGWIPKECIDGDAYHFLNRITNTYGDMFMFCEDSADKWINMTAEYGISKKNMAYNYETDSYELLKNDTYYTLQTKFAYINIDYSNTYQWNNNNNRFMQDVGVLSNICYKGDNTLHDEFQNVPIFYNEGNGAAVNINGKDSCDIDRGAFAAYERHWVLGEINTFQDLVEYKNNMFAL